MQSQLQHARARTPLWIERSMEPEACKQNSAVASGDHPNKILYEGREMLLLGLDFLAHRRHALVEALLLCNCTAHDRSLLAARSVTRLFGSADSERVLECGMLARAHICVHACAYLSVRHSLMITTGACGRGAEREKGGGGGGGGDGGGR